MKEEHVWESGPACRIALDPTLDTMIGTIET
jgi:hypothetical protein